MRTMKLNNTPECHKDADNEFMVCYSIGEILFIELFKLLKYSGNKIVYHNVFILYPLEADKWSYNENPINLWLDIDNIAFEDYFINTAIDSKGKIFGLWTFDGK
jgi:hypothetical protein